MTKEAMGFMVIRAYTLQVAHGAPKLRRKVSRVGKGAARGSAWAP